MDNSEKIFCGTAKVIKTRVGELTKISMSKYDINAIVKYMLDQDLMWVNIDVKEKKDPVPEGKATHYLQIDKFVPSETRMIDSIPFPDESNGYERE